MSSTPSSEPPRTNTLAGELHQIHAYIEATTARIHYLEEILEPFAADQIIEIKRGLKDTYRRLHRLGEKFPVVAEITEEVWQTYTRLSILEERQLGRGDDDSTGEMRRRETPTVHTLSAGQTSSRSRDIEGYYDGEEYSPTGMAWGDSDNADDVYNELGHLGDTDHPNLMGEPRPESESASLLMSGGLRVDQEGESFEQHAGQDDVGEEDYLSAVEYLAGGREDIQRASIDNSSHSSSVITSPVVIPVAVPKGGEVVTGGHYKPRGFEASQTANHDTRVQQRVTQFPGTVMKNRRDVVDRVEEEERQAEAALVEPNRKRQGSADGWLVSLAIMTGSSDRRMCVPHLMCIKIHEVRGLKWWLCSMGYLRQTHGISRTEKVLHLLTLLQMGSRFETVAVLFSRTPVQVANSCSEVFEGLLQLHSETMLPERTMSKYLYPHLWHIVGNYSTRRDPRTNESYYPMEPEDVCRVLVTINIYIGRYRSQGQFSLVGPIMNWGRYIEVPPVVGYGC